MMSECAKLSVLKAFGERFEDVKPYKPTTQVIELQSKDEHKTPATASICVSFQERSILREISI